MYYFIVNESGGSGKAKAVWQEITEYLHDEDIAYREYKTLYTRHATEYAGDISKADDDDIRLIVVGGDGTINEVLNGIEDFSRIRFGVIPVGSANDFANGMGTETNPMKQIRLLTAKSVSESSDEKRMDLGAAILEDGSRRIFGISSGIGMDAIVCKRALTSRLKTFLNKIHLGKATYVLLTIATLFDMKLVPVTIRYKDGRNGGDEIVKTIPKMVFAAGMNVPIEGGGVAMTPHARHDDGALSLCSGFGVHGFTALGALLKILRGTHENDGEHFLVTDFTSMELTSEEPMVVHTDGEYAGDMKRLRMEVMPKVLRLL